jgi:hypothetical protein
MRANITLPQPKERAGSLSLRDFYSLSTEEHNEYIIELFSIPTEERTSIDNHILKYHSIKPKVLVEEFFIDF